MQYEYFPYKIRIKVVAGEEEKNKINIYIFSF